MRKMSKPEKTFKVGAVRASVFQNTATRDGKEILFPKVVLEVRYRDKAGNCPDCGMGLMRVPARARADEE